MAGSVAAFAASCVSGGGGGGGGGGGSGSGSVIGGDQKNSKSPSKSPPSKCSSGELAELAASLWNRARVCPSCGKACAVNLTACNGCGSEALRDAPIKRTENVVAGFVYGVEETNTGTRLALSLRLEEPTLLVYDDLPSRSACHLNAVPRTAASRTGAGCSCGRGGRFGCCLGWRMAPGEPSGARTSPARRGAAPCFGAAALAAEVVVVGGGGALGKAAAAAAATAAAAAAAAAAAGATSKRAIPTPTSTPTPTPTMQLFDPTRLWR